MKLAFIPTTQEKISDYRQALYGTLVAPLDGMWEALYVGSANPFLITSAGTTLGYCCIDDATYLNQLYLMPKFRHQIDQVVTALIKTGLIQGALLSSIEPVGFNACLTKAKTIKADTLNYHHVSGSSSAAGEVLPKLRKANAKDLSLVKAFFRQEVGFTDNFGYTERLIQRAELFLLEENGSLVATGECRRSDTQPAYADIGMVVKQTARKSGRGSKVLAAMASIAESQQRIPICSTTVDNVASQKAIQKAGFYQHHIVFKMKF